jgi:hypothetical protein
MKTLILASTLLVATAALPAYADSSTSAMPADATTVVAATSVDAMGQMPSTGSATLDAGPKSRAEVYQELVKSENSGEYARLGATLYSH